MTQDEYDFLLKKQDEYLTHRDQVYDNVLSLQSLLEDESSKLKKIEDAWDIFAQSKCDHTYPDGSSAFEALFVFKECKICGKVI